MIITTTIMITAITTIMTIHTTTTIYTTSTMIMAITTRLTTIIIILPRKPGRSISAAGWPGCMCRGWIRPG